MSTTLLEARPVDSDWIGWLKRELAPDPLRKVRTAILVVGVVLCVIISMSLFDPVRARIDTVLRQEQREHWDFLQRDLNEGRRKKARAFWTSPVMASNRLVILSSHGEAVALNAKTGAVEKRLKIGESALIGPIAAGGMVYAATDAAELVAIR